MGLIAYFTSRWCKVCCTDESRGTRWDGQKNEVITFSRYAKINTAGSTSSGEVQTALLNWRCKIKKKVVVSLHYFFCTLISRSLPNLKEKYMTSFSHKLIHNSITQSKASRSIRRQMTATFDTCGRLLRHTRYARSRWYIVYNARRCAATTLNLRFIWWLLVCLFQYLKCQDQRVSKRGRRAPLSPRQLRHWPPRLVKILSYLHIYSKWTSGIILQK